MPTGAQSRFSFARAHGAFPRFCLPTKAAVSAPRFDRPLAAKLADTEQRASSRNTGRPRFRLEADAAAPLTGARGSCRAAVADGLATPDVPAR